MELTYKLQPSEDWKYNEFELTQEYLPKKAVFKMSDSLKVRLSLDMTAQTMERQIVIELIEPILIERQPKVNSNKKFKK